MPKLSKTEQLFRTLPADVQYNIEMQLYDEFNDMQTIVEYTVAAGRMPRSEIAYWKRAETARKRDLTERWKKENGN